jgi:hypothetical protein
MTQRGTWIAGGLAFGIAAIAGLLSSQLCAPCLMLPIGLAAGYLAARGREAVLATANAATQLGARAGVAVGLGALLGHLAGGALTALRGPEAGADILGWIVGGPGAVAPPAPTNPAAYYAILLGGTLCLGLVEVALLSGSAALGALIRYQQAGGGGRSTAITRR